MGRVVFGRFYAAPTGAWGIVRSVDAIDRWLLRSRANLEARGLLVNPALSHSSRLRSFTQFVGILCWQNGPDEPLHRLSLVYSQLGLKREHEGVVASEDSDLFSPTNRFTLDKQLQQIREPSPYLELCCAGHAILGPHHGELVFT